MKHGLFICCCCWLAFTAFSQFNKKLLIIGIDGCRADVITKAFAPTMDSLIHLPNTAYTYRMKNEFHTISAPNWTSMLTGVHCFRHRTFRNSFAKTRIKKYPHFFKYLEDRDSSIFTLSLSQWDKINPFIVDSTADIAPVKDSSPEEVTNGFLSYLQQTDAPDASFLHYDEVDHAGHDSGFSPKNPDYTNHVKMVDADIQKILQAIHDRKIKYGEDWLVIISTDHGGRRHKRMFGHGVGAFNPNIRRVFLIIHGDAAQPGQINKARTVDVAATALNYFNNKIPNILQGKPVGLK